MIEIVQVQNLLWAADVAGKIVLLIFLAVRKNYSLYPTFCFYLLTSLAHDAVTFVTYQRWGFASSAAWRIGWTSQAVVICARALAVAELCRYVLAQYKGVWALAWRILLTSAGLVLLYSLVSSKQQWVSAIPSAERGLDLAIASVIVGIFLFARYYAVSVDPVVRTLAIGFLLFSCFGVLNNTILERWLYDYATLWNILGMLAFFATLLLWSWALRLPQTAAAREEVLLPNAVYSTMSPELNLRLHLLNKQLSQFWNVGAPRP
jgi:hypothetical protein